MLCSTSTRQHTPHRTTHTRPRNTSEWQRARTTRTNPIARCVCFPMRMRRPASVANATDTNAMVHGAPLCVTMRLPSIVPVLLLAACVACQVLWLPLALTLLLPLPSPDAACVHIHSAHTYACHAKCHSIHPSIYSYVGRAQRTLLLPISSLRCCNVGCTRRIHGAIAYTRIHNTCLYKYIYIDIEYRPYEYVLHTYAHSTSSVWQFAFRLHLQPYIVVLYGRSVDL